MHRHENADVLLMSQSHGKIDRNILEMVQLMYRVSKKTAWGDEEHYIRKVFDGFRGGEMNVGEREYESKYFPFYKSHTKSDSSSEAYASDIVSFWKTKTMRFAMLFMFIGFSAIFYLGYDVYSADDKEVSQVSSQEIQMQTYKDLEAKFTQVEKKDTGLTAQVDSTNQQSSDQQKDNSSDLEPYSRFTIALAGSYRVKDKTHYILEAHQNGQVAFSITYEEIIAAGYEIEPLNSCAAYLTFKGVKRSITCQFAQVGISTALTSNN
jgi:zona occludens toxin